MIRKNVIEIYEDHAQIHINSSTHGKYITSIDLDDIVKCDKHKWSVNKYGEPHPRYYIVSNHGLLLHRYITDAPKGKEVDHKDGDTMNNTRSNLRICTSEENSRNKKFNIKNTSGHKGVTWNKVAGKWMAYITVRYKRITLGYFEKLEDAANARRLAEDKYYGEYKSNR